MFIYKGTKHLLERYADIIKEGLGSGKATIAQSAKCWADNELGLEWLERNFDQYSRDIWVWYLGYLS